MRQWLGPMLAAMLMAILGWQATLVATPMVLMEVAERRLAASGDYNHFKHAPPVEASHQTIVRPSPDLLYSACPFDLVNGPLEVTAWPIPGHYSSISVFNARSDAAFVRNDEEMAGQPLRIILATPSQAVPSDVEVVRLTLPRGIVLQRVLMGDQSQLAGIDPLRRRAQCRSLSAAEVRAQSGPRK